MVRLSDHNALVSESQCSVERR